MVGHVPMQHEKTTVKLNHFSLKEPKVVQWLLTFIALAFLALFLVLPLITIFMTAFQKGLETYLAAITNPDALAAIKLTLIVVLITVPLNAVFGVVAAWLITKFDFKGKNILITLIDLPFAVSPV
ncbi:MAG: sulfate ABC transporter permease subunit CysW, partial [Priestia megaterium]